MIRFIKYLSVNMIELYTLKSELMQDDLVMSYSHMGNPHTTIGAITFHF